MNEIDSSLRMDRIEKSLTMLLNNNKVVSDNQEQLLKLLVVIEYLKFEQKWLTTPDLPVPTDVDNTKDWIRKQIEKLKESVTK